MIPNMLYEELKKRGLGELYAYVMQNNKGKNNPYHNNFHLEHVALFTLKGFRFYERYAQTRNEAYPVINNRAITLGLIAALVHDLHHTGSGKDDDANIELAKKGLTEFVCTLDYINMADGDSFDITNEDYDVIYGLIDATRYPYITDNNDLDLMQKIIRDADVLQGMFVQNYINGVVEPLAKEIGIPFLTLLNGQEVFYGNTVFATEWATNIRNNALPYIIESINMVKQFYI